MTQIDILFSGVAVSDFPRAIAWYTQLFGRPADVDVTEDEAMWSVSDGGWVYVVLDRDRAGRALVTLSVGDLGDAVAGIGARGISCDPIEMVGDAGRKATYTDADGNAVSFIEVFAENE